MRAPPLRGERFLPSNPFFHAAVISDAAILKPTRARARPTNSGALAGGAERRPSRSRQRGNESLNHIISARRRIGQAPLHAGNAAMWAICPTLSWSFFRQRILSSTAPAGSSTATSALVRAAISDARLTPRKARETETAHLRDNFYRLRRPARRRWVEDLNHPQPGASGPH